VKLLINVLHAFLLTICFKINVQKHVPILHILKKKHFNAIVVALVVTLVLGLTMIIARVVRALYFLSKITAKIIVQKDFFKI
jgi:hypothetical protein